VIVDLSPSRCAIIAAAAEDMFDKPEDLSPALDSRLIADWEIVSYIRARNAPLGFNGILGQSVYFGFVARSKFDPLQYLHAWRGTEQPIEWFEDGEAVLAPCPFGGSVEGGFWSIYSSAQPSAPVTLPLGAKVHFVGHSLGAPLAAYDALALANAGATVTASLFACPKPGDAQFAHAHDKAIGKGCQVYNFSRDVVPRLPFSGPFGIGFQSLVNVNWIKPSDSKVKIHDGVACAHSALSYAALLGANVQSSCIS
jgi:triacylglycerol lipase